MQPEKEIIPDLPVKISRIEVQKKNKHRYSLFSNEQFLIGISEHTFTRFSPKKGMLLHFQLFQQLQEAEAQWEVREYLLRLLSRRDHSCYELQLKGIKKGYPALFLEEAIFELEEKGYINNAVFAEKYVRDKFQFNKWGPSKIKSELIKKKIDPGIIEKALTHIHTKEIIRDRLYQLAFKKRKSLLRVPEQKRKKKLFDFLIRKGYDYSEISKEIDQLLKHIES